MDEPVETIRVDAEKVGTAQRFRLTATHADGTVDGRRWGAVKWASKPRVSKGEFAPWWYEERHVWHLYDGEPPEAGEGELPPPKKSFKEMEDVKSHVRELVAEGLSAG